MRRVFTCVLAAALLASLTACGNSANAANSEYIYGKIDSVSGNDLVLLLAEYNEKAENADESSESEKEDSAAEAGSGKTGRKMPGGFDPSNMPVDFDPSQFGGEMPEGFDPSRFSGEMPEGFDPSNLPEGFSRSGRSSGADTSESGESKSERKRPEGFSGEMPEGFDPSQFSGSMPEGFSKPENGEMPEGFDKSQFGSRTKSSGSSYTLTGEQEELRVPVGTTVTTALGVETDFEVLKAGDLIKCSVEKDSDGNDVITAVWILEQ